MLKSNVSTRNGMQVCWEAVNKGASPSTRANWGKRFKITSEYSGGGGSGGSGGAKDLSIRVQHSSRVQDGRITTSARGWVRGLSGSTRDALLLRNIFQFT